MSATPDRAVDAPLPAFAPLPSAGVDLPAVERGTGRSAGQLGNVYRHLLEQAGLAQQGSPPVL